MLYWWEFLVQERRKINNNNNNNNKEKNYCCNKTVSVQSGGESLNQSLRSLDLNPLPSISEPVAILGASQVAQLVMNPPSMQETPVQFLDQEDPLEKR